MDEITCRYCGTIGEYTRRRKDYVTRDGYQRYHIQIVCTACDRVIKNEPQTDKPRTFFPYGKYKGLHTYQVDDVSYLRWFHSVSKDQRLKKGIEIRLKELNSGLL